MLIKAIFINLLLLAIYCMLIIKGSADADRGFNLAIGAGLCMAIHTVVNVATGLVLLVIGKREVANALLISAAILAPVCFCTWLILLSIYG